jgi:N-acetylmuramoyl-L-alanine amidase
VILAVLAAGIAGHVTVAPTCPVEPQDRSCPPRPYAARVVASAGGHAVARAKANARGRYRLTLAPGRYRVCAHPVHGPFPGVECASARVRAGRVTRLDLVMDSGIRSPGRAALAPARPPIRQDAIPFPARRKHETRLYARRHYGIDDYRLRDPKVIVEHVTVTSTFQATFNTFAPDVPDVELHELPGVCSHFVVDRAGTVHQLVPLGLMCRHTVGLNYTAIGIEHVGRSDAQVMGDKRQLRASLKLTCWLQGRFGIAGRNVIGHAESLSSPYHRERVARLRNQTHGDMRHATMTRYRAALKRACG